jgi:hypothetical protein
MTRSKEVSKGRSLGGEGQESANWNGFVTNRMVVDVAGLERLMRALDGAGAPGRRGFPGIGA